MREERNKREELTVGLLQTWARESWDLQFESLW